jgi:CubicO group peptidase (beta-lactamase class C family)
MVSVIAAFLIGSASPAGLVDGFLEAVNSKDKAKLTAFATEHFHDPTAVPERVDRLMRIAEQSAPWKLVRLVDDLPHLKRAEIEDRQATRLALVLQLTEGKIRGIQFMDPESLSEPAPKEYRDWTSISSLVADIRKDTNSPALGVAVWRKDQPLEVAVDGLRKLGKSDPVKPSDLWHIGSIGKSMTASLIGALIERGDLKWDSTLGELLPDTPMRDNYRKVTLLQVMRHRSGIVQDMTFTRADVDRMVGEERNPTKMRELYARYTLAREPLGPPDGQFRYSNAGYTLLGHIAERITKQPFEALMRQYVFDPTGMKTAVVGNRESEEGRAVGHVKTPLGIRANDMTDPLGLFISPAGNMWCSMEDLARFGRAHLDGLNGRPSFLKPDTFKMLHTGMPEGPGGGDYACGWVIGPLPGTQLAHGHNGSNGTMVAELYLFPKEDLVVASVANRGGEAQPSPPLQFVLAVAQRYAPR